MAYMTENGTKFVHENEVLSYDSDRQGNVKLSSLQRWFQDAADGHCTHFGCDYVTMREKMGVVFVLVKTSINVYKPMRLMGRYKVTTWNKGASGVRFYRDFEITGENGELCAVCGTSWVLVSPESRKMVRPDHVTFPVTVCGDGVDGVRLGKTVMPAAEYVGDKKVMYTEVDVNGHLTNWVYPDIVTNFLPDMSGKRVAEMDISYIGEAYEGETIKIYRAFDDGVYYMRGDHPRGKCFEARCVLKDIEK